MKILNRIVRLALIPILVWMVALSGHGWVAAQEATPEPEVEVTLQNQGGEEVGTATFRQSDAEVTIALEIQEGALEPGDHGIHIHETGICEAEGDQPFSSAGGHFNPTDAQHGAPALATPEATPPAGEAHAGDFGNITVPDDGAVDAEITTNRVTLESGQETSLDDEDGSALVVHADRDDLETDPSGNSGERVLCGVIFPSQDAGAATPAEDGEQARTEITVESVDIDFNPNEFTIPANTDVTVHLPNTGAALHNFSVEELGIDVDIAPGEEQTITINAPAGTYEYYCDVPGHREAGMVGTMTVE
jgi:Cu-Zn family superoxide dismutase